MQATHKQTQTHTQGLDISALPDASAQRLDTAAMRKYLGSLSVTLLFEFWHISVLKCPDNSAKMCHGDNIPTTKPDIWCTARVSRSTACSNLQFWATNNTNVCITSQILGACSAFNVFAAYQPVQRGVIKARKELRGVTAQMHNAGRINICGNCGKRMTSWQAAVNTLFPSRGDGEGGRDVANQRGRPTFSL